MKQKNAYMRSSIVINCCNWTLANDTVVKGTEFSLHSSITFFKEILSVDNNVWSIKLSHRTVAYRHACCKKREADLNWRVTFNK